MDVDRDGWFHLVVGNGNALRRARLAVHYPSGDGTFPRAPDWWSNDPEYNGDINMADVNGDERLDGAVGSTWDDAGIGRRENDRGGGRLAGNLAC